MNKKAIVTVGISGSGKTTWATKFCSENNYVNINRDEVRFSSIFNSPKSWNEYKFSNKNESIVTKVCEDKLNKAVESGSSIIISDTNLHPKYRTTLINRLINLGYEVDIKEFPITWEEACKRDSIRENGVGKDILYKQWLRWLEYTKRKTYTPDKTKPCAVIIDIDGTLADRGNRNPHDLKRVSEDTLREYVYVIYKGFKLTNHKIIILSGREDLCRKDTEEWLTKNNIEYDILLMRSEGDHRKDSFIKEELFWTFANDFCIMCVVDDRPQVCRMWNDIGLNVIDVGNPRREF